MTTKRWILAGIAALAFAGTAFAQTPTSADAIPEPTDVALFVFGLAGLLIGRRSSRSRRRRDD